MTMNIPNTINPQTFTSSGAKFDDVMWDRVQLKAGNVDMEFFTVGQGQPDAVTGVRKTEADTSERAKGMSSSEAFFTFGIGYKYFAFEARTPAELLLIDNFNRNTVESFNINNKAVYGHCTLDYLVGEPTQIQVALAATNYYQYQSYGIKKGFWPLNEFIPLAKLTDYHIALDLTEDVDELLDADLIKFELVGIRNRRALT